MSTTSPETTRDWDTLVSEGRAVATALSQNQWKLGDLALEVEAMGDRGGIPTGALDRLRAFADKIGGNFNSLRNYRNVASAWPKDRRLSSVAWSVHQALMGLDDRFQVIRSRRRWTVREAQDLARERHSEDTAPPAPHEVQTPSEGTDATYAVTWTSVVEVLRRHLADNPQLLRAIRRDLQLLFEGDS